MREAGERKKYWGSHQSLTSLKAITTIREKIEVWNPGLYTDEVSLRYIIKLV